MSKESDYEKTLDEFKFVLETSRTYFSYFVTFVSIYLASLGIFLSIFFNNSFNNVYHINFLIISNGIHLAVLLISILGRYHFNLIASRGDKLLEVLKFENVYFKGPQKISSTFIIVLILFIMIWNYIFTL